MPRKKATPEEPEQLTPEENDLAARMSNPTGDALRQFFSLDFRELDRDLTEEERDEWNAIYASYRGRSALSGIIIGVDHFVNNYGNGNAGYDQVPGVIHCGCWAHMRRKWRDAMPKGATTATSKAAVGYDYVNKLFLWERKFAKMRDEDRKNARQAMEAPLLDAYWLWLKALEPTPGSKLAEAVTYAKNQQAALSAFLEHGDVEISNNAAENAIPPFAVGRKNWSFSDTVKGAESSAIVYTLVETAKANGLEPYAYLNQMMRDLPWYGHNPSREDLNDAFPWSPRMQQLAEVDDTNDL